MTEAASKPLHVLIIGAGITGLLIAQGLKQAGIQFTIFETESSTTAARPREWTMATHWSFPMLQQLLPENLRARLNTVQPDPQFMPTTTDLLVFHNGATGEVLKELPSGGLRRLSRQRLRALCSEGIDVQYGKTLKDITYKEDGRVTAHFTDSSAVEGDVLVGTDGPRSTARTLIVGEEKAKVSNAGPTLCSVTSTYTAEQARYLRKNGSHIMKTAMHPLNSYYIIFFQDFHDPSPENWRFQIMHSSMPDDFVGDNSARLKLLKERAALTVDPWKSAIEWIPEGTRVDFNKLVYWITIHFDDRGGRVTLAGDAAHPMTPHRGQGLNHAICDAFNFVGQLKKVKGSELSLADAVESYNVEMVKRGGDEVQSALINTKMIHNWEAVLQSPLMTKSVAR